MTTTEDFEPLYGAPYDTRDPERMALHRRARELLAELNRAAPDGDERRTEVMRALLGAVGDGVWIEPPFFCDYGVNIAIGARTFLNVNCVLLDGAAIDIGADVLIGPAVQISTVGHPMAAAERVVAHPGGAPYATIAAPISIGAKAWIGGGAIVCPGVTIGEGAVIGAGSVVTRSVPAHVFAAGSPCRVIRSV